MSDLPLPDPTPEDALDIQHDTDPAQEAGPARRIPHLGHALLFFSLAFLFLNLALLIAMVATHSAGEELITHHPLLDLGLQVLIYAITLATSFVLFSLLWKKPFLTGIEWNALALRRRWYWVVPAGIVVCAIAQFAMRFVHQPSDIIVDRLMRTAGGAWTVTAFGVLVAPVTEEIAFRGFLLPALATAYDWLKLERTPAGVMRWQQSTDHSVPALVFGSVFSSLAFALLHAGQLQHAWGVVGILFGVGLALSYARLRTHSVACSTLMHATYNLSIFVGLIFASGGYTHLDRLK